MITRGLIFEFEMDNRVALLMSDSMMSEMDYDGMLLNRSINEKNFLTISDKKRATGPAWDEVKASMREAMLHQLPEGAKFLTKPNDIPFYGIDNEPDIREEDEYGEEEEEDIGEHEDVQGHESRDGAREGRNEQDEEEEEEQRLPLGIPAPQTIKNSSGSCGSISKMSAIEDFSCKNSQDSRVLTKDIKVAQSVDGDKSLPSNLAFKKKNIESNIEAMRNSIQNDQDERQKGPQQVSTQSDKPSTRKSSPPPGSLQPHQINPSQPAATPSVPQPLLRSHPSVNLSNPSTNRGDRLGESGYLIRRETNDKRFKEEGERVGGGDVVAEGGEEEERERRELGGEEANQEGEEEEEEVGNTSQQSNFFEKYFMAGRSEQKSSLNQKIGFGVTEDESCEEREEHKRSIRYSPSEKSGYDSNVDYNSKKTHHQDSLEKDSMQQRSKHSRANSKLANFNSKMSFAEPPLGSTYPHEPSEPDNGKGFGKDFSSNEFKDLKIHESPFGFKRDDLQQKGLIDTSRLSHASFGHKPEHEGKEEQARKSDMKNIFRDFTSRNSQSDREEEFDEIVVEQMSLQEKSKDSRHSPTGGKTNGGLMSKSPSNHLVSAVVPSEQDYISIEVDDDKASDHSASINYTLTKNGRHNMSRESPAKGASFAQAKNAHITLINELSEEVDSLLRQNNLDKENMFKKKPLPQGHSIAGKSSISMTTDEIVSRGKSNEFKQSQFDWTKLAQQKRDVRPSPQSSITDDLRENSKSSSISNQSFTNKPPQSSSMNAPPIANQMHHLRGSASMSHTQIDYSKCFANFRQGKSHEHSKSNGSYLVRIRG